MWIWLYYLKAADRYKFNVHSKDLLKKDTVAVTRLYLLKVMI